MALMDTTSRVHLLTVPDLVIQSSWKGSAIVSVPLNIFIDDLSADQSRRWSPLHAVQMQIAGLSLEEKRKSANTHFISASDKVGILDQMVPICSAVHMFDASMMRPVLVISHISSIIADYQMMSYVCNHSGPSAKKFCPKCMADKTDPIKKWEMRTPQSTRRLIERMGLMQHPKQMQTDTGIKAYKNTLWDYLNPHRDTPIGLLHFMYLGLAKHLIQYCYENLTSEKKQMLALHLESIDQSQFEYKVTAQSMFKYRDSRQGKDFKLYLQLASFNFGYVRAEQKHIQALTKLALVSRHMQNMTGNISEEVTAYLNFIKENIPALARKSKAHLGVHLEDDIEFHGHPLHYIEDQFEKNHRTIRTGIQHQNGHAKSRDTASQFAKYEVISHLATGGYMKHGILLEKTSSLKEKVYLFRNSWDSQLRLMKTSVKGTHYGPWLGSKTENQS
ncbi:uncharacterized protein [Argopecten irradians]|uniref:uncharacterized protein n=1 Tax=Argopecten irradians TaxID=31199 RepID=UPI003716A2B3